MPTNPFFNPYEENSEQNLLRDLTEELIINHGFNIYYCPRTAVAKDEILGEDPLSHYQSAVLMEIYPENYDNFKGDGELMSIVGFQFAEKMTLALTQHRWYQDVQGGLMSNLGGILQQANSQFQSTGNDIQTNDSQTRLPNVPKEEDLIYSPVMDRFFIIRHVNKDERYYPLGVLPVFTLNVETWDYSHQRVDTDVSLVDRIEDIFSTDLSGDFLQDNDSEIIFDNDGDPILGNDDDRTLYNDKFANNDVIDDTGSSFQIQDERDPRAGGEY